MLTDFFRRLRGHCAVLQGDLRISCTRLAAYAACWGLRAHFVVEVFVSLASAGFPLCTGGLFAHFCLAQMTVCCIIPLSSLILGIGFSWQEASTVAWVFVLASCVPRRGG